MTSFCLSVDVEEDLPGLLPYGTKGIEQGLPALFDVLADSRIHGDFFFSTPIVKEYPDTVRDAIRLGHGIGNHGMDHGLLCSKPLDQQRKEIQSSSRILMDVSGSTPLMFRAPNFSVDSSTLRLLDDEGYLLDSSILPGRFHRRFLRTTYDHRSAPTRPFRTPPNPNKHGAKGLLEVPVTPNPLRPGAPLGLGALNHYGLQALLRIAKTTIEEVLVFLVHPWELVDPSSFYPKLPTAYASACSNDLRPLQEFLKEVSKSFSTTTLADYLTLKGGSPI